MCACFGQPRWSNLSRFCKAGYGASTSTSLNQHRLNYPRTSQCCCGAAAKERCLHRISWSGILHQCFVPKTLVDRRFPAGREEHAHPLPSLWCLSRRLQHVSRSERGPIKGPGAALVGRHRSRHEPLGTKTAVAGRGTQASTTGAGSNLQTRVRHTSPSVILFLSLLLLRPPLGFYDYVSTEIKISRQTHCLASKEQQVAPTA